MSCFAEYLHAKTEADREEALAGIKAECRRDEYYDGLYDDYEEEEEEEF